MECEIGSLVFKVIRILQFSYLKKNTDFGLHLFVIQEVSIKNTHTHRHTHTYIKSD